MSVKCFLLAVLGLLSFFRKEKQKVIICGLNFRNQIADIGSEVAS